MKRLVYRIDKAGSISDLKKREEELSDPGENEVTVQVKAIGFNFADLFAMLGLYSATPKGSFIPGLEFSGVIAKPRKNSKLKEGDKIFGVIRFGAYANYLNVDETYILPLPANWIFEQGAGFICQGLTAYYALLPLGAIKKDQTVLIHSAAGGVGIYANRIAKKIGAYTIGTVGDESKFDVLKKEEYNSYLIRDNYFYDNAKKILGNRELNLVLESVGGKIFKDSYRLLAPMGRIVVFGAGQFMPTGKRPNYFRLGWDYLNRPKIDPIGMVSENKSVMAFNLIWLWERIEVMQTLLQELIALDLAPQKIGKTFSFEEMHSALSYFQSGKSVGKVVVVV